MDLDTTRLRQLAVNESGFVFDPVTGHTFTLNDTGLTVLQALKQGTPFDELVDRLQEAFELDGSEDVARDVDDFLARLREHGLVP